MICSKILSVSKKFALLQTAAEMKAGSAHFGTNGELCEIARVCKASEIFADCGGSESGLSPLVSYRRVRSHRILRKGAQACGNELLWRRGI